MEKFHIEIIDRDRDDDGWHTVYVTNDDGKYLAEVHGQVQDVGLRHAGLRPLIPEAVAQAFKED